MGKVKYNDDFKIDAVHQITERGYPVREVSERLGVSTHSLYAWVKRFSKSPFSGNNDEQAAEIRRLKRELVRVTEERDILKKPPRISPGMQNEIRVYQGASSLVLCPYHVPDALCAPQRVLRVAEAAVQQTGQ
jgi:transposase